MRLPCYELDINNWRKTGKFTNIWKLNNIPLNNQGVKEIKMEITHYRMIILASQKKKSDTNTSIQYTENIKKFHFPQ